MHYMGELISESEPVAGMTGLILDWIVYSVMSCCEQQ